MKRLTIIFSMLLWNVVTQAQNIGIGTTSPDYTLDVNGTIGINDFIYHNDDGDGTRIGFPDKNLFEITVNDKRILLANGDSGELIVNPDNDDFDFHIVAEDVIEHLFHARTDQFRIGIGTTNPDYLLDIAGSAGIDEFIYHNDNDDTKFGFPSEGTWELRAANKAIIKADGTAEQLIVNPENDKIDFIVLGSGTTPVLNVESYNELIGIGTAIPEYLLDVEGDFRVKGDLIAHLFFVESSTDKIGIGTDNPQELLDVNGTLSVNLLKVESNELGFLSNIQEGTVNVSNDNFGSPFVIPINFPNQFSINPKIQITIENTSDPGNTIFISSIKTVDTNGASIVLHSSDGLPWTTDLKIHWMAWE